MKSFRQIIIYLYVIVMYNPAKQLDGYPPGVFAGPDGQPVMYPPGGPPGGVPYTGPRKGGKSKSRRNRKSNKSKKRKSRKTIRRR
jgi:hypothetical protein